MKDAIKKFKINRLFVRGAIVTAIPFYFYLIVPDILRYSRLPLKGIRNTELYILLDIWYKVLLVAAPIVIAVILLRRWSKTLMEFKIRDTARVFYKYNLVECCIIGDTLSFEHANGDCESYDIGEITNLRKFQDDIIFLYGEDAHRYTDYYTSSLYKTLHEHWRTET